MYARLKKILTSEQLVIFLIKYTNTNTFIIFHDAHKIKVSRGKIVFLIFQHSVCFVEKGNFHSVTLEYKEQFFK